jgi:hypothetical protein
MFKMPVVLQRLIQKVRPGKWDQLDKIDKKYDEIEKKYGFPPKRRYRALIGPLDNNTVIIEREWKSTAQLEDSMLRTYNDPEYQKLGVELEANIIESQFQELYVVWPLKV